MKKLLKQLPIEEKQITISNFLTLTRITLTPIICSFLMMQQWHIAWTLFVIAAITDLLDGFFARLLQQQTFLGACLDPIADKFLIVSVFFTLALARSVLFAVPTWFATLILCKELMVICGTIMVYCIQGFVVIKPTFLGKITTTIQMIFIAWVFACYFFHWMPIKTFNCMLVLMLILVVGCLTQYAQQAWPIIGRVLLFHQHSGRQ